MLRYKAPQRFDATTRVLVSRCKHLYTVRLTGFTRVFRETAPPEVEQCPSSGSAFSLVVNYRIDKSPCFCKDQAEPISFVFCWSGTRSVAELRCSHSSSLVTFVPFPQRKETNILIHLVFRAGPAHYVWHPRISHLEPNLLWARRVLSKANLLLIE